MKKCVCLIFAVILMIVVVSCRDTSLATVSQNEEQGFFTELRESYIDRALQYEGFSEQNLRSAVGSYSFDEKCNLLSSLVNRNIARCVDENETNAESDSFYEDLNNQFTEDILGTIAISYSEDDEQVTDIYEKVTTVDIMGYGYSVLELLDLMEQDDSDNITGERSLYKIEVGKWNNTLNYRFEDSVSDVQKTKVKSAMKEWENASGNKLKFVEIENSGWNKFSWTMGINHHLKIYSDDSDSNIGGSATIGPGPWKSFRIANADDRTYLHELGHVLGLMHEHQRYDRDKYIVINYDNIKRGYKSNFNVIGKGYDVTISVTIEYKFLVFDWNII